MLVPVCCGLATVAQEPLTTAAKQEQPGLAIRSLTNLTVVRVVVRDAKGNAVSGLTRTDFQLFDNKKPQVISSFSAETAEAESHVGANGPGGAAQQPSAAATTGAAQPLRFTGLFFDDYHMEFGDLVQIREAAKRYLEKRLEVGERVAIFSASGNIHVEFTNDQDKLEQALSHLVLAPRFEPTESCPKLPVYLAQRVLDMDQQALQDAEALVRPCYCHLPECPQLEAITLNEAKSVAHYDHQGAATTIAALEKLVRRMAETPGGERTIALVSDGFLNEDYKFRLDVVIDRALHAKVVINALDAEGLFVELPSESEYARQGRQRNGDVLLQTAEGTGGVFVQNTNDVDAGLARIGALRTSSYLLGFAPTDLKFDGQFHSVAVKLTNPRNFTVQARRGYFAPKQAEDAVTAENEMVEQAMFSEQELSELPVQFTTKFDKLDPQTTKFSVIADVDLRSMRFRKEAGHNLDDVTMMVALFDGDGNYVTGQKKTLRMHLSDATLRKLQGTGATMTTELNVKPGSYQVRAVVLESESQQLASGSQTVAIP